MTQESSDSNLSVVIPLISALYKKSGGPGPWIPGAHGEEYWVDGDGELFQLQHGAHARLCKPGSPEELNGARSMLTWLLQNSILAMPEDIKTTVHKGICERLLTLQFTTQPQPQTVDLYEDERNMLVHLLRKADK